MAPHSSTLAWKIPWTEGPGGLHPQLRLLSHREGHLEQPRCPAERRQEPEGVANAPQSPRNGREGEGHGHLGVTGEATLPGSLDGPLAWTGGRGWSLISATAPPGCQASLGSLAGGALWRPLGAISIRGAGQGCCKGLMWPVWTGSQHCLSG